MFFSVIGKVLLTGMMLGVGTWLASSILFLYAKDIKKEEVFDKMSVGGVLLLAACVAGGFFWFVVRLWLR